MKCMLQLASSIFLLLIPAKQKQQKAPQTSTRHDAASIMFGVRKWLMSACMHNFFCLFPTKPFRFVNCMTNSCLFDRCFSNELWIPAAPPELWIWTSYFWLMFSLLGPSTKTVHKLTPLAKYVYTRGVYFFFFSFADKCGANRILTDHTCTFSI